MLRCVDGLFMAADEAPLSVQAAGIAYVCGDKVLLLRRASGDHAGTWAFPAGKVEGGETPAAAAARESQEEVGMQPGAMDPVQTSPSFSLFKSAVEKPFEPVLNDEHDLHVWAKIGRPPAPLHPAVAAQLKLLAPVAEDCLAADHYAFDKSVRRYDQDGRLRIEMANISKANVCEYIGDEIPGWEELGLQAKKLYKLYRDPDELARGAKTFDGIPVLDVHVPSTAWDHPKGRVIGTTGSSTEFKAPYLRNSLVIWTQDAIDDIESRRQRELSCGYRYRADMTPGKTPGGEAYDGVMRDILGNHVAVVAVGRAGPDVIIGDAKLPPAVALLLRNVLACDVEWEESKHKRDEGGKFSSTEGASGKGDGPKGEKGSSPFSGRLSESEVEGIVGNSAFSKNLRGGRAMAWKLKEDAERINTLTKLLADKKTTQPVTLWRGLNDLDFVPGGMVVGAEFTDPAFVSTTDKEDSAFIKETKRDGGVVLKINVPAGASAAPIEASGYYADEAEVLLQRGAKFRITGVRSIGKYTDEVSVDLVEIDPKKTALSEAAVGASEKEKEELSGLLDSVPAQRFGAKISGDSVVKPHELLANNLVACDAEWDESKHKRADNGQFGSGGGSGAGKFEKQPDVDRSEKGSRKEAAAKKWADTPEESSPAENVKKNAAAQPKSEEPKKVQEKKAAPFVSEFIRANPTMGAMKAALKGKEAAHLEKALGLIDKAGHQGAESKMVRDLISAELASRGASSGASVTLASGKKVVPNRAKMAAPVTATSGVGAAGRNFARSFASRDISEAAVKKQAATLKEDPTELLAAVKQERANFLAKQKAPAASGAEGATAHPHEKDSVFGGPASDKKAAALQDEISRLVFAEKQAKLRGDKAMARRYGKRSDELYGFYEQVKKELAEMPEDKRQAQRKADGLWHMEGGKRIEAKKS